MWIVVKTLLKAELLRLWRWVLRKPEPPGPYADFRGRRDGTAVVTNPQDPADPGL